MQTETYPEKHILNQLSTDIERLKDLLVDHVLHKQYGGSGSSETMMERYMLCNFWSPWSQKISSLLQDLTKISIMFQSFENKLYVQKSQDVIYWSVEFESRWSEQRPGAYPFNFCWDMVKLSCQNQGWEGIDSGQSIWRDYTRTCRVLKR